VAHPGVRTVLLFVPTLHEIVNGTVPVLQFDVEQHEYFIPVFARNKLVGHVEEVAHVYRVNPCLPAIYAVADLI